MMHLFLHIRLVQHSWHYLQSGGFVLSTTMAILGPGSGDKDFGAGLEWASVWVIVDRLKPARQDLD